MLSNFTPRPYQAVIFSTATQKNTLVVLPTGLGKTAIALLLAARRSLIYPKSKIVFLAPTKPLVEQQLDVFKKHLLIEDSSFALFTGAVSPTKREETFLHARFIFSTPQTLENDVLSGRISLKDVSLLIVDEAHRATGDYAYVFLAQEYQKTAQHQRILALSASPGTDKDSIEQVMQNLAIEAIEFRRSTDNDVKPFTQETDVLWLQVTLPEHIQKIVAFLQQIQIDCSKELQQKGFIQDVNTISKSKLLQLQNKLHNQAQKEPTIELLQSISLLAQSLKLQHALELAQTQSLQAFFMYAKSILTQARSTKTKAVRNLAADHRFVSAFALARDLLERQVEHPKLTLLISRVHVLLEQNPQAKCIVFSQYRDSAQAIHDALEKMHISSSLFFGQAKKNGVGFSQKQQKEVLQQFSSGAFSVLIATSVAEEGLDIPTVDHVFFFEPVPSAIRTVQRRGRTGRHQKGFVSVLVTKGTRDEAFRWVAHHKEKRMYDVLETLRLSHQQLPSTQKSLQAFTPERKESEITIVVDYREKGSPVMKSLRNLGVSLRLEQLSIGDFLLHTDVCVEYKRFDDFVDSIIDGRILMQVRQLAKYSRPVLIIEYASTDRSIHRRLDESALQGMIATIATSFRIPVIQTFSPFETAKYLFTIAKKYQDPTSSSFSFHQAKPFSDKEVLEYVVSSFPGIGPVVAKSLLESFDSLQELFAASQDDLKKVDLVGKKKAKDIKDTLSRSYKQAKNDEGLQERE